MQAMLRLLQEGVWRLPVLSRHEKIWWSWTNEKELRYEAMSNGKVTGKLMECYENDVKTQ